MYLYAITDHSKAAMPAAPGLGDVPPLSIPYRDVAAVVSALSMDKIAPTQTYLWRHEAVVEALMADRTVLPARFGTMVSGEAAVQAVLVAHYDGLVANLKWVCGRVELGLRVLWDGIEGRPSTPECSKQVALRGSGMDGRSYLLARLEEERQTQVWRQRAEVLAAEIHSSLAPLAVESTYQVLMTDRMLLVAAYLVERDQMTAFQRMVNALKSAHLTLDLLCTGPWPPYNFVTVGALAASEEHGDRTTWPDLPEAGHAHARTEAGFWPGRRRVEPQSGSSG